MCRTWRSITARLAAQRLGDRSAGCSDASAALRIGASGLRSSWASVARNSSLRRSASASARSARRASSIASRSCRSASTRAVVSRRGHQHAGDAAVGAADRGVGRCEIARRGDAAGRDHERLVLEADASRRRQHAAVDRFVEAPDLGPAFGGPLAERGRMAPLQRRAERIVVELQQRLAPEARSSGRASRASPRRRGAIRRASLERRRAAVARPVVAADQVRHLAALRRPGAPAIGHAASHAQRESTGDRQARAGAAPGRRYRRM